MCKVFGVRILASFIALLSVVSIMYVCAFVVPMPPNFVYASAYDVESGWA